MNNSPLKKPFLLTGVLTAITLVIRLVQQFALIDHSTGFYKATALGSIGEIAFNLILLVCAVLIVLSVRRQANNFSDQPKQFSREFFVGLMLMGFTAELSYLFTFLNEFRGLLRGHGLYLPSALPAVIFVFGGVLLLYQGLLGISGKQESIDLASAAILSLWGAAALVCTYLSHTVVYHVSDNMLHILAVAAMAFFLTNCLKYMMGAELAICGRRAVHYALLTFYFGVTLFLPRTLTILVHGGNEALGAPTFSELLFVIVSAAVAILAAYAICFAEKAEEAAEEAVEVVEEVQE
ncbi:MAG: hypothetical protein J6Q99_00585 [Oscillospiraceae bacterium]|nr:hypothetical protein [Oscillospiraceae bacterium]